MRTGSKHALRRLLRANPDGLSVNELATMTNRDVNNVRSDLKGMPDTYIDRWGLTKAKNNSKAYYAVWCIVTPPADCPHPKKNVVAVYESEWTGPDVDAPQGDAKPSA